MNYVAQRQHDLLDAVKSDGVEAVLVTNPISVTYLTGFTGDSSYLLLRPDGAVLISDARYEIQLTEECPGLDVHVRPHSQPLTAATGDVLSKARVRTVGLEADHVSLALFEAVKAGTTAAEFKPLAGRVESLRSVKDPSEVEQIREAVRAAERAFAMFKTMIRDSDTEKDLVDAMDGYIRRTGAIRSSFSPIVAVGERGALPHAVPTDRTVGGASKMLVDWGADMMYKSDLTRSFRTPFGTNPTRRSRSERTAYDFEAVYAAVVRAQDAAAAAAVPGATGHAVDAAARGVLAEAGYGDLFTHGTGHGLGLEVHELPAAQAEFSGRHPGRHGRHDRARRVRPRVGRGSGRRRLSGDKGRDDPPEYPATRPGGHRMNERSAGRPGTPRILAPEALAVANEPDTGSPRPFDVKTVKFLIRMMARHDLAEIALQEGEHRIRLRKAVTATPAPAAAVGAAPPQAPAVATPITANAPPVAAPSTVKDITSEMVGNFYTRPAPGKPDYVQVGSVVKPDTVVCVIVAMKVNNEITAGIAGRVTEVCVKNEDPVDFGTVLFRVDTAN